MPIARKRLIDESHCGDAAEHRRGWVRDLIREASEAFAIDVLA